LTLKISLSGPVRAGVYNLGLNVLTILKAAKDSGFWNNPPGKDNGYCSFRM
jgi:hypothetical protein